MNSIETLPELKTPPVVEAVLDIGVRSTEGFSEESIMRLVREHFPGYPDVRQAGSLTELGRSNDPEIVRNMETKEEWKGVLIRSSDGFTTIQFVADGYFFSRTFPYNGWDAFIGEALHGWQIYRGFAKPLTIDRLGLRFIYRIELLEGPSANLGDYLVPDPQNPLGPEFNNIGLFHSERFSHRETRLLVDLNKTVMPAPNPGNDNPSLVLDIEAFTTDVADIDEGTMEERLTRMHRLVEQVLFSATTEKAIGRYQ